MARGVREDGRARTGIGDVSCVWDPSRKKFAASRANPNPDVGPRRLKAYASTAAGARELLEAKHKEALVRTGELMADIDTVAGWLDWWLVNVAKRRLRPKSYQSYEVAIRRHIAPNIGHIKLRELTVLDVDKMVDSTLTEAKKNGQKGTGTAIYALRVLSKAIADGMSPAYRKVDYNVVTYARQPKAKQPDKRALSLEEAFALTRHMIQTDHYLAPIVCTLLFTSKRIGEVAGLTWDRVHLSAQPDGKGGWIDIQWQLQELTKSHGCGDKTTDGWPCGKRRGCDCPTGWFDLNVDFEYRHLGDGALFLTRPKTAASIKAIPLTPQLNAILTLQARKTRSLVANEHDLVFLTNGERQLPVTPRKALKAFKESLEATGLPTTLTIHELRHTSVSWLKKAGADLDLIRRIVGHSSAITTSEVYLHIETDAAANALGVLDNFLDLGLTALD